MSEIVRRARLCGFLMLASLAPAAEPQAVVLPAPQKDGGKPLMQALNERRSTREFRSQKLPDQVLANLLWAAHGINRADGRRTAPTASNRQEIDLYLITAEGAYLYDVRKHALEPVVSGDLRQFAGTQAFVRDVPLNLVWVADYARMGGGSEQAKTATAWADTGFAAQNVYLFCASEELATVVRGSVDRAALEKALRLRPTQHVTLAQSVGYPAK